MKERLSITLLYQIALMLMVPAVLYARGLITVLYGVIIVLILLVESGDRKFNTSSLWLFGLIPFSIILSGINSSDVSLWMHALLIKLPFLLIPLAIYRGPKLSESYFQSFVIFTVVVFVTSTVPVLYAYISNTEQMLSRIAQGQPLPTPIEHVKYSMMMAFVIISALYLLAMPAEIKHWRKLLLGCGALWLIVFMHILAVRTGLVILYLSLGVLCLHWLFETKQWRRAILLLCLLPFMFIGFYKTSSSLRAKIGYMFYDFKKYQEGNGINYSDSERLLSWHAGWRLFIDTPLVGTGAGDIQAEVDREYKKMGYEELYKKPHNQLLYVMASSGIVGLLLFVFGFFGPTIVVRQVPIVGYLYLNYMISFIVENSLERSISVAFFVIIFIAATASSIALFVGERREY